MLVEPMLDSETYTPGKFKIWCPMIWDMWFNEPMDGDWEVLKEETCWSWWELYIHIQIDITSFAIQKWALTAHLRMINGETDLFLRSFRSNTLGSLTNAKRWYWNHNWTVSGGLSIKLGDPVEPPKTWGVEVLQIRVNIGLNHGWLVVSYFVVYMFPCELYILISNFNILSDINILFMFNA
jgi:hypothetical protein